MSLLTFAVAVPLLPPLQVTFVPVTFTEISADGTRIALDSDRNLANPGGCSVLPGNAESSASFILGRGPIAITEIGRDVLAGRIDRVGSFGLDRWFGGVHLQSVYQRDALPWSGQRQAPLPVLNA